MQVLMQRYESALRRSSCPSTAPRPTRPTRRFDPQSYRHRNGEADQENQVRSTPGLSRGSSMPAQKRIPTTIRTNSSSSVGAVNEEDFRKAFTQVPKCDKLEAPISRLCEALLPATISLIQNSAKIMSSSGVNACYFIVKYVEHPKIIPIVLSYASSKSKEIRKSVQDLLSQIIAVWTPSKLEKSLSSIVDCVKVGLQLPGFYNFSVGN
ncbi:unnamed protein product [Haemonchus placei]|uniref:CLASP_N domain-containing protein n=1 Tax=Haemonchus placei TaxID=6290 RepID=A0A0N4X195_HAEPC|nr:unnamed protein product [Haemonchus placei]